MELSTNAEKLQIQGWWRMYWNDPVLSWDAKLWGVAYLNLGPSVIWVPDVTVFHQRSQDSTPVFASVYPDGSVFMSVPHVTTVGCSMNLTDYPFDVQHCSMTIGSWSHS